MITALELLAPAGDAEIGMAAIDHGADAVYVGAPKFSARAGAGVSLAEISRLIEHAHFYYAKVYVALNTILTDQEIAESLDLIREIYALGADALIIQDVGLLELHLPPIPLIASTQMHNSTPEKVRFLEEAGFKRVILARELSLSEIADIRGQTSQIELESFVHGALCVSYSGQCYLSQAVAGRSGNRGVCAQPCRSHYTLMDGDGNKIQKNKYLLSLKDLNLLNRLPELVAAGVTSFKIEGRYKGIDYVKNVTAAYRRMIDEFINGNSGFRRSSSGHSEFAFTPDPDRTFNRSYTQYFISGPGCPVCVTSARDVDIALYLAGLDNVIFATFGDMLRVSGAGGESLQKKRASGANVRVVSSADECIALALANPQKEIIMMGIGFETTAPTIAAVIAACRKKKSALFRVKIRGFQPFLGFFILGISGHFPQHLGISMRYPQ